jgi:hypothetical protein
MPPLGDILSYAIVLLLLLCGALYFGFVGYHLIAKSEGDMAATIRQKGVQTLGLPLSALGSFALVIALPAAAGQPLAFKGLGFDFSGPSSQIVLWNFTFLVFNLAIWLTRDR